MNKFGISLLFLIFLSIHFHGKTQCDVAREIFTNETGTVMRWTEKINHAVDSIKNIHKIIGDKVFQLERAVNGMDSIAITGMYDLESFHDVGKGKESMLSHWVAISRDAKNANQHIRFVSIGITREGAYVIETGKCAVMDEFGEQWRYQN